MDVFLLPRDVLLFRDFPERCLPHFQDIKEYLKVRTVTLLDVLNQNLSDVLVVSHRHRHVTGSFIACAGFFFFAFSSSHVFILCLIRCSRLFFSRITRWESRDNPDVTGDQLRAMRSFLEENERFKFVWFDFCCLPQRTRTFLEEWYFKIALKNVNLLYLHAHVLVIYDRDYNRRFWCLYETFLGCRMFDGTTLVGFWGCTFFIACFILWCFS